MAAHAMGFFRQYEVTRFKIPCKKRKEFPKQKGYLWKRGREKIPLKMWKRRKDLVVKKQQKDTSKRRGKIVNQRIDQRKRVKDKIMGTRLEEKKNVIREEQRRGMWNWKRRKIKLEYDLSAMTSKVEHCVNSNETLILVMSSDKHHKRKYIHQNKNKPNPHLYHIHPYPRQHNHQLEECIQA